MRKHGIRAAWRQRAVEGVLRQVKLVMISRIVFQESNRIKIRKGWQGFVTNICFAMMACAIAAPVHAAVRAVTEGLYSTNNAIFVSTLTAAPYVRVGGTMTVTGDAFSVGTSTLVVSNGNVGVGATSLTAKFTVQDADVSGTTMDALRVGGISNTHWYDFMHAGNGTAANDALYLATILGAPIMKWRQSGIVEIGLGPASTFTAAGLFKPTTAGIQWADGTTTTTTFPTASSQVAQSSTTRNFTGTTSATSFSVCYATQTITTGGSAPVQIWYNGALRNSGAISNYCILNVLQDGNYISPYTSTQGMAMSINTGSNLDASATLLRVVPAPSAGSHSWCLQLAASANNCDFSNVSFVGNEFGVMELR